MTEEIKHHKVDTHSYKGWLNSDSFLKRAFAITGYNFVASLIISIPFYIITLIAGFALFGMMGLGNMGHMGGYRYGDATTGITGAMPAGKINIEAVCEQIAASSNVKDATALAAYTKACISGDYQQAVNAYIKAMGGGDGKAI